jgi:cytochrome c556
MIHLRMAIFAAFFLMPINIAFAHDGATGVVKKRMDFMSNLGAAMKSLSKIVKGRVEFDSDKVLELTAQLREHSGTNLTKLFPKGSLDKPTTAIPDIREQTGVLEYPTKTHRENLKARISAVAKAGDKLETRDASSYVSKLIIACVKLAPPDD